MVPAGNKAKRLSSVNHTTKTIHHHHHSQAKQVHKGQRGFNIVQNDDQCYSLIDALSTSKHVPIL